MPKKGGKKGKGKKKEEDWGTIAREQYVTIEVRWKPASVLHSALCPHHLPASPQMRNSKWQSMRFKHVLAISEPVDFLRQMVIDEHRLGGSQGLKLFLGELDTDDALIKPEDYTQPISSLQVAARSCDACTQCFLRA